MNESKNYKIIDELFKSGGITQTELDEALMECYHLPGMVKLLCELGANVNKIKGETGNSLAQQVAIDKYMDSLYIMLDYGVDDIDKAYSDYSDSRGFGKQIFTMLEWCVYHGDYKTTEKLLKMGASVYRCIGDSITIMWPQIYYPNSRKTDDISLNNFNKCLSLILDKLKDNSTLSEEFSTLYSRCIDSIFYASIYEIKDPMLARKLKDIYGANPNTISYVSYESIIADISIPAIRKIELFDILAEMGYEPANSTVDLIGLCIDKKCYGLIRYFIKKGANISDSQLKEVLSMGVRKGLLNLIGRHGLDNIDIINDFKKRHNYLEILNKRLHSGYIIHNPIYYPVFDYANGEELWYDDYIDDDDLDDDDDDFIEDGYDDD